MLFSRICLRFVLKMVVSRKIAKSCPRDKGRQKHGSVALDGGCVTCL
jgi:hypothetical protein